MFIGCLLLFLLAGLSLAVAGGILDLCGCDFGETLLKTGGIMSAIGFFMLATTVVIAFVSFVVFLF